MKVLLVIASQGYQPIEFGVPRDILKDAGIVVETASNKSGKATAADCSQINVDHLIKDVDVSPFDGIFFIGGGGALENLDNQASYDLLNKAAKAGKFFGAICISPRILAKAGVLTGKKATGWDGDNNLAGIFAEHDVVYVKKPVVVDGKIITAVGPSAAQAFGDAIVKELTAKH